MQICEVCAGPVLFYGRELWTVRTTDEIRLVSAEICFMGIAGYSLLNYKRNGNITRPINSKNNRIYRRIQ
jgi:hypothetical protein